MADASSSTTATCPSPRSAGASSDMPVDANTIRQSYEAVLSSTRPLTGDDRSRLSGLLRGHLQLLVPELARIEPRMHGEQRRTAQHVLTRTRHMLAEGTGTSSESIWSLAIQCRALLTLHQHPGPLLTWLAHAAAEGRS